MFLRGVGNMLDPVTRVAPGADLRPDRLQDGGLRRRPDARRRLRDDRLRLRPPTTRCRSARRAASAPASPAACSISTRATAARRRARTKRRRRRTPSTTRPRTASTRRTSRTPSTARWSTSCPATGLLDAAAGASARIVNARSGVPINVTISRPDNATVNGATVTNIPGGNSRGTQRPDLVPGVDPVSEGRRALAEPGGVHDAAAGHVRQPAAQLPARARASGRPT